MSERDEFYRRFSRSYDKLHQSEKQDDLVERVAAVLASVEYLDKPPNHTHRRLARAAIAVLRPALRAEALEEAARVAECRNGAAEWSVETNSGYECAAREIAAAIRNLIPKEDV